LERPVAGAVAPGAEALRDPDASNGDPGGGTTGVRVTRDPTASEGRIEDGGRKTAAAPSFGANARAYPRGTAHRNGRVPNVVVADATDPMVATSADSFPGVVGVAADAERLPLPPEAFDAVTCRIAAHRSPDPEPFRDGASRVRRRGVSALPSGVVAAEHPTTELRLYHASTDTCVDQVVPITDGEPAVHGVAYVATGCPDGIATDGRRFAFTGS
jgi:hypothetical protein